MMASLINDWATQGNLNSTDTIGTEAYQKKAQVDSQRSAIRSTECAILASPNNLLMAKRLPHTSSRACRMSFSVLAQNKIRLFRYPLVLIGTQCREDATFKQAGPTQQAFASAKTIDRDQDMIMTSLKALGVKAQFD